MTSGRPALSVVPPEPEPAPDPARDIYAEARMAALDSERWRRMHESSDRSRAISLPDRIKRLGRMGGGTRRERGGFKFEERA